MTDHIDPKLQEYYENYFEMFGTKGWQQFMHELKEDLELEQASAATRCDTSEKWFMERGMQFRAAIILGFENSMRANYESIQNPVEEEYLY